MQCLCGKLCSTSNEKLLRHALLMVLRGVSVSCRMHTHVQAARCNLCASNHLKNKVPSVWKPDIAGMTMLSGVVTAMQESRNFRARV